MCSNEKIKWFDAETPDNMLVALIKKKVYLRENKYAPIKSGVLTGIQPSINYPFYSDDLPLMAFGLVGIKEEVENVNTNQKAW